MHELSGAEKTKHVVIGKLTAIVGHCELLELEAESQHGKERLQKIISLALDIAERVLTCNHEHLEATGGQKQLAV